jgi:hypothetical protein
MPSRPIPDKHIAALKSDLWRLMADRPELIREVVRALETVRLIRIIICFSAAIGGTCVATVGA